MYLYGLGNPVNRIDPSGELACDGLSGSQLAACLDSIQQRISLYTIPTILDAVPVKISPALGYQFSANLVKHYLDATGTTLDFGPDDFSSGFTDYIGNEVLTSLKLQSGVLESDLQANFGPQLCAGQLPLAVFGHSNFFVGDYQFSKSISPTGGYHYGTGTVLLNAFKSSVYLSPYLFYPKYGVATVETIIELFDHYDWCYGSALCEARDVQGLPGLEFHVGESMALEKAGRAAQFDWYAQWIVQTEYDVDGTSGTIKITGSRYVGYKKLSGPPLHYSKAAIPSTYWNSPWFDDDWRDSKGQLCQYDARDQASDKPGCVDYNGVTH